jgi:diguanylate cyclase (GGDEF)-like protein/PAS domain S-box-containing protein
VSSATAAVGPPPPAADPTGEGAFKALAATLLFAAGATLALVAIALPHPGAVDERGIVLTASTAYVVGLLIWLRRKRITPLELKLANTCGTALVTCCVLFTASKPSPYTLLYIWVGLYAFYFISLRWGVIQTALVGAAYTAVPPQNLMDSALVTGTVLVAGVLVAVLLDRLSVALSSERSSAEQVRSSLSVLEATLESTADGILVVDANGRMVRLNQKFIEMWRMPDDIVESRDDHLAIDYVLKQLNEPDQFLKKVADLYADPSAESYDILEFKDGRVFERYSKPQRSGSEIVGRVWSFRDITDRDRFESELLYLADHDVLTGLFNRRRFEQDVERRVAYAARYGTGGAVLMLDLDDFKDVNDTLGHRAGDELIKDVARLLAERLRRTDSVARLGGDEFAVLLPEADEADACATAQALLEAIRRHRSFFRDRHVRVTASVGIALVSDVDDGGEEDEPLGRADVAMYEAKESGRDRYAVYVSQAHRDSMEAKLTMIDRIRGALENDLLQMYCQPILDLRTGRISQYELLLRMLDEEGHVLPPKEFLGIAERYGLMNEIDRWVVNQAIGLVADREEAGDPIQLEVNLSAKSLGDPRFPEWVEERLAAAAIDTSSLIFEITETAAIANMDVAKNFVNRLTSLGCRFALDDFGAGFGSFHYVKHLPVDYVKIDGDFVRNVVESSTDQSVVKAIVQLARGLGKKTIAEFVGDEATVHLLREYGVDFAQGYHIGVPAPVQEVLAPSTALAS